MSSNRLFKSVSMVSSMTLLSRVLGFVRDVVCAQFFGAAAGFDAFLVAFKIPNFMRRLFAEGAFSQAFVPVLTDYQAKASAEEVSAFIGRMIGTLLIAVTGLAAAVMLLAPWVVKAFAPGFSTAAQFSQTATMLRYTIWYLPLISLTALVSAVLNCHKHFALPAAAPILLNLCLIAAVMLLAPGLEQPNFALAWAVPVAGALQLLLVGIKLTSLRGLVWPRVAWADPGVRRVVKLMLGAIFAVSVSQINLLFDTFLASFLPAGSISWLYYSDRLMNFPLGVFAVAISTVTLPYLSSVVDDAKRYQRGVSWGLRTVLWIGVPAAVGLGMLAGPLLTTLFQYQQFSTHDVQMAARSLLAFALGVPAFMAIKVMVSVFYAKQDVRTPVKIAVRAMGLNMALNLGLILPLAHAGLALATVLAAWVQAALLWRALYQRQWVQFGEVERRCLRQIGCAALGMAGVLLVVTPPLVSWGNWPAVQRVWVLLSVIAVAKLSYYGLMRMQGWRLSQLTQIEELGD